MPFRPSPNLPTFSDLKITLAKSDTPDSALYQTIQVLIDRLEQLHNTQAERLRAAVITGTDPFNQGPPEDVVGFVLTPFPTYLRAEWEQAASAAGYEIHAEAVWDTNGPFAISTPQLFANIDPIVRNLVIGSHPFAIKAVNFRGDESVNAAYATLVVPPINAPLLAGSGIANSALLSWSTPVTTWRIRFYNVFRDGVQVAQIDSNFMIVSVLLAGTYTFQVQAVDIVGNLSAMSPEIVLALDDPIDLFFIDSANGNLNGTYVRTKRHTYDSSDGVLGPIDDVKTWQTHFTSQGWNSPQDQINAGFPYYIQPTVTDGYYQEQFDFGQVFSDITIVAGFAKFNIIGNTQFSAQISYSTDNVTYSPFEASPTLAGSIRYARVRWIFTNVNATDLGFITNLTVSLSTQLVMDSGEGVAHKADVAGTVIPLNKVFLGINSVTMSPRSSAPLTLIFDNTDAGVSFNVWAFDNAGNRVDCEFTWKVRGIV